MVGTMTRPATRSHVRLAALALALSVLCLGTSSCASIEVSRSTQTSGRFESKATSYMLLWWDIPRSALDIARDNAADARLTNVKVTEAYIRPHFGWFDWLWRMIGFRKAVVRGTWGFDGSED